MTYTVHLIVRAQVERGPEPEWDDVARGLARTIEGRRFWANASHGPRPRLVVESAIIDTADDA